MSECICNECEIKEGDCPANQLMQVEIDLRAKLDEVCKESINLRESRNAQRRNNKNLKDGIKFWQNRCSEFKNERDEARRQVVEFIKITEEYTENGEKLADAVGKVEIENNE